uniref:Ig-like domain-containing protein n=1 Tax=Sarcophilus harrisii TaxID=9305 RepID=A0A7N4UYD0_SARHA
MEKLLRTSLVIMGFLLTWVSCQQRVEQNPPFLHVQEKENITINCTYSDQNTQGVQWYRQYPGKALTLLIYLASGTKQEGRFKFTFSRKDRFSSLHIIASQPGDSATYLCAMI